MDEPQVDGQTLDDAISQDSKRPERERPQKRKFTQEQIIFALENAEREFIQRTKQLAHEARDHRAHGEWRRQVELLGRILDRIYALKTIDPYARTKHDPEILEPVDEVGG